MTSPRLAAAQVLRDLCIADEKDLRLLDLIALGRGAVVQYRPLLGAEARLTVLGAKGVITVSTSIRDARRRRFSVAHELGHHEMHRRQRRLFLCSTRDIADVTPETPARSVEQEANEFAAELLLPEPFFAPLCDGEEPSLELVAHLASDFKTSLTATCLRYLRFTHEACAVVYSRDGTILWSGRSKEFAAMGLSVKTRCRPDPSSVASSFYAGHPQAREPRRVKPSAWLSEGRYDPQASILEQSWPMPSYNAVLTLLWVDREIVAEQGFWRGEG